MENSVQQCSKISKFKHYNLISTCVLCIILIKNGTKFYKGKLDDRIGTVKRFLTVTSHTLHCHRDSNIIILRMERKKSQYLPLPLPPPPLPFPPPFPPLSKYPSFCMAASTEAINTSFIFCWVGTGTLITLNQSG